MMPNGQHALERRLLIEHSQASLAILDPRLEGRGPSLVMQPLIPSLCNSEHEPLPRDTLSLSGTPRRCGGALPRALWHNSVCIVSRPTPHYSGVILPWTSVPQCPTTCSTLHS